MEFNDIKTFIDTNKDSNEELKTYLQGFNKVTVEGVQKFLTEDKDAKSWLDSTKDQHANKHLETWKTNQLQKLINEEVMKRNPSKTPLEIEVETLKADIAKKEAEYAKKELHGSVTKTLAEKQLDARFADYLLGSDLETTNSNIANFESVFNEFVQKQVEARIGDRSHTPPKGGNQSNSEIDGLEVEYQAAMKASNMPLAISLKNKIVALRNKK